MKPEEIASFDTLLTEERVDLRGGMARGVGRTYSAPFKPLRSGEGHRDPMKNQTIHIDESCATQTHLKQTYESRLLEAIPTS
jgi:hypothetical protein